MTCYAELWKRGAEATRPNDINNLTSSEVSAINRLAGTYANDMTITELHGSPVMQIGDGSIYNIITRAVKENGAE